jgi:hypothetical protein
MVDGVAATHHNGGMHRLTGVRASDNQWSPSTTCIAGTLRVTSWPLITDFTPILKNAPLAFADERLRQSVVETDVRGQPVPRSGQFATVFKVYTDQGQGPPLAVRVFTKRAPERRERYEIMANHLARQTAACLVWFSYQEKGVRCARDGRMYPLVVMDWIEGQNLFDWVQLKCRQRDAQALANLGEQWVRLIADLEENATAHGDLQHANILIDQHGVLKLVDYDCLYVPGLKGRTNLELGVAPYQHPGRNPQTLLSIELQRFSALFVYTVLQALAAWPDLWDEHVSRSGYDKLLFRTNDLAKPEQSQLCRQLSGCSQAALRSIVDALITAYQGALDEVPSLQEVAGQQAAEVNVYRDWLRIDSAHEPNFYQLLGIPHTLLDPREIRIAAENRMNQVLHMVSDQTRGLAAQLLSEINGAQLTLMHNDARRRYDEQLIHAESHAPFGGVEDGQSAVACPLCHAELTVPRGSRTSALRCPTCGNLLEI